MLASVSAPGADTPAGTSGGRAEPSIASELDTFNVALNKQLQVIRHLVLIQHSKFIMSVAYTMSITSHERAVPWLQGDPRDAIINFVREEGLDLLLVGRSLGGRFKKVPQCF